MNSAITISKVKCQICEAQGLIRAEEGKLRGRKVVICQNEFVRHIRVNGKQYICRTRLSNEYDGIGGELILN